MKVLLISVDVDWQKEIFDIKLRVLPPNKEIEMNVVNLFMALLRAKEPFFISIRALRERKEEIT